MVVPMLRVLGDFETTDILVFVCAVAFVVGSFLYLF